MRNLRLILFVLLCAAPLWAQGPPAEVSSVPITYLPGSEDGLIRGHLFWVPVKVNGQECKFILDTGIGLNLVSQKLAGKLGCPETGETFEGQRMSGQTVEVPLSWYSQLSLGSVEREFVTCGVLDFEGFLPRTGPFEGIEGFLSLRFFQHLPFTIDYERQMLYLETAQSLESRLQQGTVVPIEIDDDRGVALAIFAPLTLPGVGTAKVEVDTGSDSLILHERYMPTLGISSDASTVKTVKGKDETDHTFVRYFASGVEESAQLGDASQTSRPIERVMFQDIIYDGLIGDDFLRRHTVTFDLSHSRMIIGHGPGE